MQNFLRRWECGRCKSFASALFYCSSCWKLICKSCYDPFIGVCKGCVGKLFRNAARDSRTVVRVSSKDASPKYGKNLVDIAECEECATPLIVTPDGTKCCPLCGLVVGKGYSWMGSGGSGRDQWSGVIDNIERILEERVSRVGWG